MDSLTAAGLFGGGGVLLAKECESKTGDGRVAKSTIAEILQNK